MRSDLEFKREVMHRKDEYLRKKKLMVKNIISWSVTAAAFALCVGVFMILPLNFKEKKTGNASQDLISHNEKYETGAGSIKDEMEIMSGGSSLTTGSNDVNSEVTDGTVPDIYIESTLGDNGHDQIERAQISIIEGDYETCYNLLKTEHIQELINLLDKYTMRKKSDFTIMDKSKAKKCFIYIHKEGQFMNYVLFDNCLYNQLTNECVEMSAQEVLDFIEAVKNINK